MATLWGRASSVNVQKVTWALRAAGVAFESVAAGGAHGGLDTRPFLAMNPHGRIPVLFDDAAVIWESNAIVRYVCARYSTRVLWPENAAERAIADQWMDWCACTLQPAFMGFFWSWWRTPEPQRDATRCAAELAAANSAFARLDEAMERPPFDRPSMAWFPAGSLLFRYFTLPIERPRLAALEAWYALLTADSAYPDAVMIPFADLKGRLAY